MFTTSLARAFNRVAAVAGLSMFIAGCGSGTPATQVHTSVRPVRLDDPLAVAAQQGQAQPGQTQPVGTLEPAALPALPQLSSAGNGPALSQAPERRLAEVNIPPGTPLSTAVAKLGQQFGMTVNVDPDVRGTTQANLRNVTFNEALSQIVPRGAAQYQVQGNVLRVVPVKMETRNFSLDYVAISRVGTMSTVVQRRLASNVAAAVPGTATGLSSFSGAAAAASGGDVLTSQTVSDVWQDIRVALTGIMQAGVSSNPTNGEPGATAAAPTAPPSQAAAGFTSGPQASSTPFADGSVLIITPSAGIISVTAFPEKIAAVQQYLDDFRASILRQVRIEAKIVEVQLDRTSSFGIDWSVVSATTSGKFGVTLKSDPSVTTTGNAGNVNFTLTGGNTTVSAVLNALESQGTVNVLSNENTTALNNQRAIFQVTTDQVFFTVTKTPLLGANGGVVSLQSSIVPQQISTGVILDVVPQISGENVLTMDIRPAVTNVLNVATLTLPDGTSTSAPNIARREGDTVARLRGGETMVIGGLVQSRTEDKVSGIPILKDIPLLGKAFQHIDKTETRSELVVFLTPTIISGQPAPPGR